MRQHGEAAPADRRTTAGPARTHAPRAAASRSRSRPADAGRRRPAGRSPWPRSCARRPPCRPRHSAAHRHGRAPAAAPPASRTTTDVAMLICRPMPRRRWRAPACAAPARAATVARLTPSTITAARRPRQAEAVAGEEPVQPQPVADQPEHHAALAQPPRQTDADQEANRQQQQAADHRDDPLAPVEGGGEAQPGRLPCPTAAPPRTTAPAAPAARTASPADPTARRARRRPAASARRPPAETRPAAPGSRGTPRASRRTGASRRRVRAPDA